MTKGNNLSSVEQRKDELKMVLDWKITSQLNVNAEYRVTIAYHTPDSKQENIKVLGFHSGIEIPEKILSFFDKFLTEIDDFGLLVEAVDGQDAKNWDISFSRKKAK